MRMARTMYPLKGFTSPMSRAMTAKPLRFFIPPPPLRSAPAPAEPTTGPAYAPPCFKSASWVPCSDDIAPVKHVDFIRRRDIGKAMRDEQHRLAPGEGVDLCHDVVLALHIDVGGGLIKDVYRAVVEQRPGEGQALALAAGEVLVLVR